MGRCGGEGKLGRAHTTFYHISLTHTLSHNYTLMLGTWELWSSLWIIKEEETGLVNSGSATCIRQKRQITD